jgi:hypothetical protein
MVTAMKFPTQSSLHDPFVAVQRAHNNLLAAHQLLHSSTERYPESAEQIIPMLRPLGPLTAGDLAHRKTMLIRQLDSVRRALDAATVQRDRAHETLVDRMSLFGALAVDRRILRLSNEVVEMARTIRYITRALPTYERRIAAHTEACTILAS